jgi:dTMP kinase
MDFSLEANKINRNLLKPDLTIYIDIDPVVASGRITSRNESKDIYENLDKLIKVREGYISIIKKLIDDGENIITIEGDNTIEVISEMIWKIINEEINKVKEN